MKLFRVDTVAASHTGDYGRAGSVAAFDYFELGSDSIRRVDYIVILREIKAVGRLRQEKDFMIVDARFRRNIGDAPFGDIRLVFPYSGTRGCYLSVYVRLGDLVAVDQVERSDAAARESLDDKTADAADAEHCHRAYPWHHLRALKPLVKICYAFCPPAVSADYIISENNGPDSRKRFIKALRKVRKAVWKTFHKTLRLVLPACRDYNGVEKRCSKTG